MKPRIVGSKIIAAPAPTKRMIGVMLSATADSENLSRSRRMPSGVERIVISCTTANISVSRIRSGGMPNPSLHANRIATVSAAPTSALHMIEDRRQPEQPREPGRVAVLDRLDAVLDDDLPRLEADEASPAPAPRREISANRPKSTTPSVRVAKPR